MLFSTIGQGYVFLWMMAAGAVIGAWFYLVESLRKLLQAGVLLNLMMDILFGAGAAILFIAALVTANYGKPRLFTIIAAMLGCALFAMGVWPPVRAAGAWLGGKLCCLFVRIKQLRWIKVIFR